MKISVVIPTYNSARLIAATLESVLRQTVAPDEILVLDDGSTDNTVGLLRSYGPRVTVLQQKNQGVAAARNALARHAQYDLVAFLDHDDFWHPRYLETQRRMCSKYPEAVACFAGHVDFQGDGSYEWTKNPDGVDGSQPELLPSLDFFERYSKTTGVFGSMSFCCVPKKVLTRMGDEPFRVSGVDDSYLSYILALLGSVVYFPAQLVAYRFSEGAQSSNRLRGRENWVTVFELLEEPYRLRAGHSLHKAFRRSFALARRGYGKLLMGAGKITEARRQFLMAAGTSRSPASVVKSLGLYGSSLLPQLIQPQWPGSQRVFQATAAAGSQNRARAIQANGGGSSRATEEA